MPSRGQPCPAAHPPRPWGWWEEEPGASHASHAGAARWAGSVSLRGGHLLLPRRQHLVERVPADGGPGHTGRKQNRLRDRARTSPWTGACQRPLCPLPPDCQGHVSGINLHHVRTRLPGQALRPTVRATRSFWAVRCPLLPNWALASGHGTTCPSQMPARTVCDLSPQRQRTPHNRGPWRPDRCHSDGCHGRSRATSESQVHQPDN